MQHSWQLSALLKAAGYGLPADADINDREVHATYKAGQLDPSTFDTEHKPLACPTCGTERIFIGYATKIGKNSRPAKWPVYEDCPNQANHPTKKQQRETSYDCFSFTGPVFDGQVLLRGVGEPKEGKSRRGFLGVTGVLFQAAKGSTKFTGWLDVMADQFYTKTGNKPATIYINPQDSEQYGLQIGDVIDFFTDSIGPFSLLVAEAPITPRYNYVMLA